MESPAPSTEQSAAGPLIVRCQTLLDEIHLLANTIKEQHLPVIEIRAFRSNVQSELKFLQNVS